MSCGSSCCNSNSWLSSGGGSWLNNSGGSWLYSGCLSFGIPVPVATSKRDCFIVVSVSVSSFGPVGGS